MHPKPLNLDNRDLIQDLFSDIDWILTDCDGVLWVNNSVIAGVPTAIDKLRSIGKRIAFATNNSTKTREQFLDKMTKLGYSADVNELFPTSFTTALYLKAIGFDRKVFVLGSSGITGELAKVGIKSIGVGPDPTPRHWTPGMAEFDPDEKIGAVVVGFDNQISFPKLVKACSYVRRPDVAFLAANADESYPSPPDSPATIVPGPGAYLAAIESVTGQKPICLGKPFKYFFDCIRRQHPEIDPKRTLMIGDRLTTDIAFGKNIGAKTLFVQSGISTMEEMANFRNSQDPSDHLFVPDFYIESLAAINKHL